MYGRYQPNQLNLHENELRRIAAYVTYNLVVRSPYAPFVTYSLKSVEFIILNS